MRKRRKVLIILGLIGLAVVCFVTLKPHDEPKYQGRYLREWIAIHRDSSPRSAKGAEADHAILTIGTNGLPILLEWIRNAQPAAWRTTLYQNLPARIRNNPGVDRWLLAASYRALNSSEAIYVFGTNAISAMAELETIMNNRTDSASASLAVWALGGIGEPALPVLQRAFADTNQSQRATIVCAIVNIAKKGHSHTCLPILTAALDDNDAMVRFQATNAVRQFAPELLPPD
jgi:hypothetical protein